MLEYHDETPMEVTDNAAVTSQAVNTTNCQAQVRSGWAENSLHGGAFFFAGGKIHGGIHRASEIHDDR